MNALPDQTAERISKGRIRMEITSFLMTERHMTAAINQDVEIEKEDVPAAIAHVCRVFAIALDGPVKKPRHGFKVSTLVGFIHERQ